MGISLNGLTPANTYPGLIKTGDNTAISGTPKVLSDGNGNNLPMEVSTTGVNFTNNLTQGGTALQPVLVSGTNIKTINGTSVLGSGNIVTPQPSGVAGAIQFSNGSAFASDAANFFWDDTNNRLGVGTNTPSSTMHIRTQNSTANGILINSQDACGITITGDEYPNTLTISKSNAQFGIVTNGFLNISSGAGLTISKPTINGSGSTSATTSLLVQNSSGAASLQVTDDGSVYNLGKGGGATNTAFGRLALISNTSGGENTVFGVGAGASLTTGSQNTAMGYQALTASSGSQRNIAIGNFAMLLSPSTAANNVAIGYRSMVTDNGSSNIAVGSETSTGGFSGSVILGCEAAANGNNQFVVGSSTTNAGAIDSSSFTQDKRWKVKINGVDYYIALQTA
jgi:hypothetical protein